jgi:drug/metabolite transporter (DMT)-like permease
MGQHVLSIIIAFLAYSVVDVGKALQKHGLVIRRNRRVVGSAIWVLGTSGTVVSSFLILWAVSIGSVVVVGSMAGTGLVAATLYAVLILHERVRPRDIIAICLVLAGPFLLGAITTQPTAARTAVERLIILAAVMTLLYALALVFTRRSGKARAFVIAAIAGMLSGYVVMFQKLASSEVAGTLTWVSSHLTNPRIEQLVGIFANPFAVIWLVLSVASTVVLQLSYRKGDAVQIIPTFNSVSILTLIVGGLVVFGEVLHVVQWLGIVTILVGAAMLMFPGRPAPAPDAPTGPEGRGTTQ